MLTRSHNRRYAVFLECLVEARKRAGVTQVQLAEALKSKQTIISKCERGERRLDVVDLLEFLAVYGADAAEFVSELEAKLSKAGAGKR